MAGRLGDVDSCVCRRRVMSSAGRGLESPDPSLPPAGALCQGCGNYLKRASLSRRAGAVVARWSVLAPVGRVTRTPMQPARAVFSCQPRWFSLQKLGTGSGWLAGAACLADQREVCLRNMTTTVVASSRPCDGTLPSLASSGMILPWRPRSPSRCLSVGGGHHCHGCCSPCFWSWWRWSVGLGRRGRVVR